MTSLTPEALAELSSLAEDATPGPWWHEWVDGDDWWAVYGQPTGGMVCPEVCTTWSSDDAAYIAAAVNALPDLLDRLAHMTEARDNARAEVERLAALVAEVREWIDRRGVNVGDRDDDYMRGYRDAQRHAVQDAAELRATLDGADS